MKSIHQLNNTLPHLDCIDHIGTIDSTKNHLLSCHRSRYIRNSLYDPSYEAMGLPIDPHLRLFLARPNGGTYRSLLPVLHNKSTVNRPHLHLYLIQSTSTSLCLQETGMHEILMSWLRWSTVCCCSPSIYGAIGYILCMRLARFLILGVSTFLVIIHITPQCREITWDQCCCWWAIIMIWLN